ncbi:hypothetical protein TNIN_262031, partial [Trichonephila inaurata madagascariensis]
HTEVCCERQARKIMKFFHSKGYTKWKISDEVWLMIGSSLTLFSIGRGIFRLDTYNSGRRLLANKATTVKKMETDFNYRNHEFLFRDADGAATIYNAETLKKTVVMPNTTFWDSAPDDSEEKRLSICECVLDYSEI